MLNVIAYHKTNLKGKMIKTLVNKNREETSWAFVRV